MRSARLAIALLLLVGSVACSREGANEPGAGGGQASGDAERPNYGDKMITSLDKGHISGARGDMQTLSLAITQYVSATGNLPEADTMEGLAALLSPTYVRRLPRRDPWGTPYDYQTDGDGYWLTSAGHDREFDTEDDVEVTDGQITKLPEGYERLQ